MPVAPGGHGLVGVHGTVAIHEEMPVQLASVVNVHAPVALLQHAPLVGCGQGLGVQEGLAPQLLGTAQETWAPTVHAPAGVQQVPCAGCGQVFTGVHEPPAVHVAPAPHADWSTKLHAPVWATQQVPCCGCGQGLGVQVIALCVQIEGAAQLTWVPNVQPPVSGLQQLPIGGCGHGLVGVQDWPCVHCVLAAVHWNWKVVEHAPVVVVQQVPLGGVGQGLAAQVLPCVQVLVPAQFAWITCVQAPVCVQHVPPGGCGQGLVGVQV